MFLPVGELNFFHGCFDISELCEMVNKNENVKSGAIDSKIKNQILKSRSNNDIQTTFFTFVKRFNRKFETNITSKDFRLNFFSTLRLNTTFTCNFQWNWFLSAKITFISQMFFYVYYYFLFNFYPKCIFLFCFHYSL